MAAATDPNDSTLPDTTPGTGPTAELDDTAGGILSQVGNGPHGPIGDAPYQPSEYTGDPFDFNTAPSDITGVPDFGGEVNHQAAESGLLGPTGQTAGPHTTVNANGTVSIAGKAVTRQVQDEELVSKQMGGLLSSDSKYMQDARRQGMEQANALGGLGGTVGAGASMQAALRAALPIATADAQAFQAAASENLQAQNQYAQLNLQRATQLEGQLLDAKTSIRNNSINVNANLAMKKLESATSRDISMLDADTRLRAQEMQGQIQARMSAFQYQYDSLLTDQKAYNDLLQTQMQGEYNLADRELAAQWESYIAEKQEGLKREATANQLVAATYDGFLNRIAELNGQDMSAATRESAIKSITSGFKAMMATIAGLYPDLDIPTYGDVGNNTGGGTA